MASDNTLKRLGRALLDATLLLVALVLLLAVVLVWQLRGLADDLRTGLRSELVALQPQLEAARDNARAALEQLGTEPAEGEARQELQTLIERLDALDPDALPPAETESLLRRLVLAIIATAAQGVLQTPR